MASRGTIWPVGLFGFVSQTMRVRSPIAAEHGLERKLEPAAERHLDHPAAHGVACTPRTCRTPGTTTTASNGAAAELPRRAASAARKMPSSRPFVSSSQSAGDAQPRRARRNRVVVVRIDRDVLPRQRVQRREHGGRAAGRVLVQVQPQPGRRRQDPLVFVAHRRAFLV